MTEPTADLYYPLGLGMLPDGWSSTFVGDAIFDIQPGFASGVHNQEGVGVAHLRPMNIDRAGRILLAVVKYVPAHSGTVRVRRGDVLFNNTNSPELVGKTASIDRDADWAFSNHMTRLRPPDGILPKFLSYQLHFLWMSGYFLNRCTKHVNQASIAWETLTETVPLIVAPQAEQQRIVAEIEKHVTRLDASVAALERAQANLKRYRAAVLRAAWEGRLVATEAELARAEGRDYEPSDRLLDRILKERRAKWEADELAKMRAAGKEPKDDKWKAKYGEPLAPDTSGLPELREGWTWISFDHAICKGPQNGLYKPASAYGDGMPILRIEDYQDGFVRPRDELRRLDVNEDEAWTYGLNPDDLVINRVNSPSHLGKSLVVPSALCPAVFESNMMRMVVAKDIAPRWILLYIRSRSGRTRLTAGAKWAVNQASINQTDVRVTPLPLPPLAEQGRIVAEVERRLSVVEELETSLDHCVKRADRLRQSVLKRAFEGKLVPQNPNDEPASVLLERIRAGRAAQAHARNSRLARPASRKRRMRGTPAPLAEHQTGAAE